MLVVLPVADLLVFFLLSYYCSNAISLNSRCSSDAALLWVRLYFYSISMACTKEKLVASARL